MKIKEIVSEKSEVPLGGPHSVAFRTEPPLSEDVFINARLNHNFWTQEGDLLVWISDDMLTSASVNDAEQRLTMAEQALQGDQTRAVNVKQNYLQKISKQTGLPVK
jgi:hypothetical protein